MIAMIRSKGRKRMKRTICLSLLTMFVLALPAAHMLTAREPHFAVCVTSKFRNTGHLHAGATRVGQPPSDVDNKAKANFCFKWIDSTRAIESLNTREDRRRFLLNLICFACCIEGLFFFAAFAYVYFMRSKGLLNGLASGTNWVFRDESMHMQFALEVVDTARREDPDLFDDRMNHDVVQMLEEAVDCEMKFAEDILGRGVPGMSIGDMRKYLEFVADQRLQNLGMSKRFGSKNPFSFMDLQDVQELSNFFERRVSAYQFGVTGEVAFDESF